MWYIFISASKLSWQCNSSLFTYLCKPGNPRPSVASYQCTWAQIRLSSPAAPPSIRFYVSKFPTEKSNTYGTDGLCPFRWIIGQVSPFAWKLKRTLTSFKASKFLKEKLNPTKNIPRFKAMKVVGHVTLGVTCRGVPFKPSFFHHSYLFCSHRSTFGKPF